MANFCSWSSLSYIATQQTTSHPGSLLPAPTPTLHPHLRMLHILRLRRSYSAQSQRGHSPVHAHLRSENRGISAGPLGWSSAKLGQVRRSMPSAQGWSSSILHRLLLDSVCSPWYLGLGHGPGVSTVKGTPVECTTHDRSPDYIRRRGSRRLACFPRLLVCIGELA